MMQNLWKKNILVWSGCLTIYIQLQYFICYNYSLTKQETKMQKYQMLSVCILFWKNHRSWERERGRERRKRKGGRKREKGNPACWISISTNGLFSGGIQTEWNCRALQGLWKEAVWCGLKVGGQPGIITFHLLLSLPVIFIGSSSAGIWASVLEPWKS